MRTMLSATAVLATLALSQAACDTWHGGPAPFDEPMTLAGKEVSAATLNAGRESYTLYCRACHGDNGDGAGPASFGLRPPPRDFRQGIFKFGWVIDGLPRDEDLSRIVKNGLHGTAMLQWDVPEEELTNIAAYIKTFAPEAWADAGSIGTPVEPTPDPWGGANAEQGIARGRELYHGQAQCWTCHPAYATKQFIAETRKSPDFRPEMYLPEAKVSSYTSDGTAVRLLPPDFAWSELRSIRPESQLADLFSLIGAGIPGTAMPQWKGSLPDEDIWAMAHYVHSIAATKDKPAAAQLRRELQEQPELVWPLPGSPEAAGATSGM